MQNTLENFLHEQAEEENHPKKRKAPSSEEKAEGINQTMASFFVARPLCLDKGTIEKPVARYGRIYKRKAPNHSKAEHSKIPCPPGHRVCKICQKALPLEAFYSNVKRYVCKFHHYQMVYKRTQVRFAQCNFEKYAMQAWVDLFYLCPMLGYAKVEYDRHDIKDILINTKIPMQIGPRIVPIDPTLPLRPRNLAVLSVANMHLLVKIYSQSCSVAQYILFVQCCNLVPENADVGYPSDPYQDPQYKREDIDVIPLLEKERTMPKERPHIEAVHHSAAEEAAELAALKMKRSISKAFAASSGLPTLPKKKKASLVFEPPPPRASQF